VSRYGVTFLWKLCDTNCTQPSLLKRLAGRGLCSLCCTIRQVEFSISRFATPMKDLFPGVMGAQKLITLSEKHTIEIRLRLFDLSVAETDKHTNKQTKNTAVTIIIRSSNRTSYAVSIAPSPCVKFCDEHFLIFSTRLVSFFK